MKILLIINPISGTLPKDDLPERVGRALSPLGFDVETVLTTHAGHATELARKAADEGYYGVIAAGGDGTINEIGAALAGSQTALGILPFGSGNGLARHLYGSIDVDHALETIAKNCVTDCDYGTANGRPFFCTFGFGFDANVSKEFAEMPKRGLVSYVRSALQELVKFTPTDYEIDTGSQIIKVKAFIVAVCNASQYGNNAYIAPQASVHDGLLDITIIHAGNPLTRALAGVELFTGRLDKNILIQTFSVKRAIVRHIPGPAHIDGEPCTMPQSTRVVCHAGDIRMFTDPDKPPFRPYLTPASSLSSDSRFLIRERIRIVWSGIKRFLGLGKRSDRVSSKKN